MQCRLCNSCWLYWKRYGGLKNPSRYGDSEFDLSGKKKSGSDLDEDRMSFVMSHRPHRYKYKHFYKFLIL